MANVQTINWHANTLDEYEYSSRHIYSLKQNDFFYGHLWRLGGGYFDI